MTTIYYRLAHSALLINSIDLRRQMPLKPGRPTLLPKDQPHLLLFQFPRIDPRNELLELVLGIIDANKWAKQGEAQGE